MHIGKLDLIGFCPGRQTVTWFERLRIQSFFLLVGNMEPGAAKAKRKHAEDPQVGHNGVGGPGEVASEGGNSSKRQNSSEAAPRTTTPAAQNASPSQKPKTVPPKTAVHEVALPPDFTSNLDASIHGTIDEPAYTGPMAKHYPFTLDPFQSKSVAILERRESVLVSAHTSAGKTAIAEYAIAMAFREKTRVIYTSPLKVITTQGPIVDEQRASERGRMAYIYNE